MTATIYTTRTCAYCPIVKKWLQSKGIAFNTVELDDNPKLRQELLEKTGAMTVPITEIKGKYIIGWNPVKLAEAIA